MMSPLHSPEPANRSRAGRKPGPPLRRTDSPKEYKGVRLPFVLMELVEKAAQIQFA
jgi:hypothetical protein